MKKWLFSIMLTIVGILVLSYEPTYASELPTASEIETTFDLSQKQPQKFTYLDEDEEEVTISIEPVLDNTDINLFSGFAFPYGTSTFKVQAVRPHMGMHFYIKVNIPKTNVKNSTITSAYNPNHWVIGGSISDTSLKISKNKKTATYSGNASWFGGLGGSSVWLKGTLNENILSVSARY